ncbi:MAG: NAD(P)-dependent glycerol-3-phosphate dehydrogenase [Erysipelotrichia bacterium]|nr:NAD(P)-dependent glycerol-3-phosphate dehydrogenase [Erysipelotrichia bacterium]
MKKIGILGSGTWGTALANLLTGIGHQVTLWSKFPHEKDALEKNLTHPNLPGVKLNSKIYFSTEIVESVRDQDIIVFATPSVFVRETALLACPFLSGEQIIVTVAKGIEEGTLLTTSEAIRDTLKEKNLPIVALSGPTHAEEVALELPSCIVAACEDLKYAEIIQNVFYSSKCLRVYTNQDILGVEICGALKNIIAIATGMSDGLGYGDNAKAALITRGLREIICIGLAMGANVETFSGLTGIGDIVVTATSAQSRNYQAGYLLGQGYSLQETLAKVGMVVEGLNCLKAAIALEKKYDLSLPIIDSVYRIVEGKMAVREAVSALFARKKQNEINFY